MDEQQQQQQLEKKNATMSKYLLRETAVERLEKDMFWIYFAYEIIRIYFSSFRFFFFILIFDSLTQMKIKA